VGRPITPEDLSKYKMISNPSLSPDGKRIAISIHQASLDEDAYLSDVWLADSGGSVMTRFTSSGKDSDPLWSPDGRSILFLSRRSFSKDEKGNELYVMPVGGGEARSVVRRKEGIEGPKWSADSRSIYFVSAVFDEEKDDVKVVKRINLWFNGKGFTYNARGHIFVSNIEAHETKQLTKGNFEVIEVHPSHDGSRIAYLASLDDLKPYITDIFVRELETGDELKLTSSDASITTLAWSPDDKAIAFTGNTLTSGLASHDHLWAVPASGGHQPTQVEKIDRNKANTLNSDVRSKTHGPARIEWEGDFIYYAQAVGGAAHLCRLKPGKEPELVVGGERSLEGFDVRGRAITFVSMDSQHLEELYVQDGRDSGVTSLNRRVYEELDVVSPSSFSFVASDGERIEGWVLPPSPTHGKSPAILYIHGGPKTAFGFSYMHELQVYAAAGFAVIYTNPRGSDGYTERFADIRGNYGDRDFKDLMEALDQATKQFPFIDETRLGIAGGSYGGFMTNWAVGHTDRFKAAVADRSISSWISFFGTSDIGPYFTEDQMAGDLWADEGKLLSFSPLRYAKNVTTPLLLVHSVEDYRCWMVEGLQFFTALKYLGKEAEMVLFPGENHDLSRTGKPKHRVARLKQYLRWFDAHLKSVPQVTP